ncbi:MAG: 3-hydroxyacyl-CoA dehydrogenase NAD-binding domain-containing protein, partial [Acidobacteriota bacterium]
MMSHTNAKVTMKPNINREILDSGLCILTFDRPRAAANFLDQQTLEELNAHLDFLESVTFLKGLVIRSNKPGIFIAGADLNVIRHIGSEDEIRGLVRLGQRTFSRLSDLPLTTVAAIHGACLGGGLELALACDHRIASSHRATKIGLPEVQLGILPAWGGTTRLPRLISFALAAKVIVTGKAYAPQGALKLGIVDSVVFQEYLFESACKAATGAKRTRPRFFLTNTRVVSQLVARKARRDILAKTRGNFPAPLKALETMTKGLRGTIEDSLELEKDAFIELTKTEACGNLINLFFLQERSKKLQVDHVVTNGSKEMERRFTRAAVIGGGTMGAGIAQWLSSRQLQVLLNDISNEQLAKGMMAAQRIYHDGVKRRVLTDVEARMAMDRICPVSGEVPLHNVDLVIEAVVEKMDLKKEIFRRLEARTGPETLLASNTSALSITEISHGLARPQNLVGIHFFNPVHRMKLVEIVRGENTGEKALERALKFVKDIGKLPVIVRDRPGFLINRVLMPYLLEAVELFQAGHSVGVLDRLMLQFGMPMGPLRLLDEVGLDVSQDVAQDLHNRLNLPIEGKDTLERLLGEGWTGKKSGRGFYLYGRGDRSEATNSDLARFQNPDIRRLLGRETLQDRMVLPMVNEAARVLEEGVVGAPEDADFGMIMGTGWAPFRGGPLRYADTVGVPLIVEKLERMQ